MFSKFFPIQVHNPAFREMYHSLLNCHFSRYLDHYRDKKDINKEVILQRIKDVHPFGYRKQMQPRKFPNIVAMPRLVPSWMKSGRWKKRNLYRASIKHSGALPPLSASACASFIGLISLWSRGKRCALFHGHSVWSLSIASSQICSGSPG